MEVNAPADPRTPSMATATAERRWADVGVGKEESYPPVVEVALVDMASPGIVVGEEDVKNEVGRAIRTTPRSEMRDAYWAERGKGSLRKR